VRLLAAALAVLLVVAGPATAAAAAAATCPKTSLPDIEDEVMCLQCGVPLAVAEEAPSAKRERAFIQQQVDACRSKQEIKDQLVAQFGDRILTEPQQRSAWLVPAVAFALGALAVAAAAWRWRNKRRGDRGPDPGAPAAAAPLAPSDAARLDADLDRYDL
jgi:cytochrome c-type biogenesis protein CcmH/NrfF